MLQQNFDNQDCFVRKQSLLNKWKTFDCQIGDNTKPKLVATIAWKQKKREETFQQHRNQLLLPQVWNVRFKLLEVICLCMLVFCKAFFLNFVFFRFLLFATLVFCCCQHFGFWCCLWFFVVATTLVFCCCQFRRSNPLQITDKKDAWRTRQGYFAFFLNVFLESQ